MAEPSKGRREWRPLAGTAHFNLEANLTRDHQAEAFLDVILEGPPTWKVRPVFETFYDRKRKSVCAQSGKSITISRLMPHIVTQF